MNRWGVLLALLSLAIGACVATGPVAPAPDRSPTPAVTPPAPSAWPPPIPSTVDGKEVLTVSAAIAARDAARLGSSTFVLGGYWSVRFIGLSCPAPMGEPGELELYCRDGLAGITEQYEAILDVRRDATSMSASPPKGPALSPWVPPALEGLLYTLPMFGDQFHPPVPIVVSGHFDDARAPTCRVDARKLCRERLVLESILVFDPASVAPPTPTPPPTPFPSPAPPGLFRPEQCNGDVPYSFVGWTTTAELDSSADHADHAGHVWAVVTRDVVPIGDWFEDPNLPRGHFSRAWGRRVCLATEMQPEGVEYNVLNGTAYREWDDGRRTPDDVFGPESGDESVGPGGPLPSLPPAISSEMRGPGLAHATILVRDWSELLVSARPATDAEMAAAPDLPPPAGAMPLTGDPRSLLVVWADCGSDTGATLVVIRDRSTVLIKADPRTDCVDPGTRRAAVLTFGTAVPPKVGAVAVL